MIYVSETNKPNLKENTILRNTVVKFIPGVTLTLLLMLISACVAPERRVELQGGTPTLPTPMPASAQQPTIAASPVDDAAGDWKVASNDAVTLTLTAPGANEVAFLYRPVIADEDSNFVQLKNLIEPTDRARSQFQTNLQTSEDFAGDVWARVSYPDGAKKETEHLLLTTRTALGESEPADASNNTDRAANNQTSTSNQVDSNNPNRTNASIGEDESQRSDKATGGKLMRVALKPNNPDIRITVNVPAFKLTLWQNGKEVATYPVGVGRKKFPIPIGERTANKIILNPAWIPPDSSWVRASSSVEPYERIEASDPRNPLGKIKIPLGDAYLLHEAQSPSDLGNLVSHGCVRVLREDLFDIVKKIARARSLPISNEEIDGAQTTSERRVIELDQPVTVDINYDTHVVEGGVLHLYPDVYERDTNTIEKLRAALNAFNVDFSMLDDGALKEMLNRVNDEQQFVVKLADIKAGRALERGTNEPLTQQQAKKNGQSDKNKATG